jgi:hypothetical protein
VLAEARHLAVADREDVDPFGLEAVAGLLDRAGVAAEGKNPIGVGEELARRELGKGFVLGDDAEELLDGRPALARPERRIVLAAADRLPVDVRIDRADDGFDPTLLKRCVRDFTKAMLGLFMAGSCGVGSPDTGADRRTVSASQSCDGGPDVIPGAALRSIPSI